eukprot:GHRQ01023473.1.p1 GENE.GHRQ01023473.1~~GHRQ01023473.1.p1  ORF type:complete len:216 (+),score=93.42 GHRQ01023473.1:232-879(+)
MEAELETSNQGLRRSKYRGLSWDKKYQGWRVRIYYAGKQRHVGRFEDEVSAASAYDKAAVYLYGTSAITNFGLDACLKDPTETSSFIIQAKDKAEQPQQGRSGQHAHQPHRLAGRGSLPVVLLQAALQHGGAASTAAGYEHQQLYQAQPSQQQLQLPVLTTESLPPGLLMAGGGYPVSCGESNGVADAEILQQLEQLRAGSSSRQQQQQQQMPAM